MGEMKVIINFAKKVDFWCNLLLQKIGIAYHLILPIKTMKKGDSLLPKYDHKGSFSLLVFFVMGQHVVAMNEIKWDQGVLLPKPNHVVRLFHNINHMFKTVTFNLCVIQKVFCHPPVAALI